MAAVGMEILFCVIKTRVQSKEDALIGCIHWSLISNGFMCIGIGEQESVNQSMKTELLPDGWNDCQDAYVLQYQPKNTDKTYMLKVIKMGDTLLVHFLRKHDEKVTTVSLNTTEFTSDDLTSFESAYKNLEKLNKIINKELISPMHDKAKEPAKQTEQQIHRDRQRVEDVDPLRVPHRRPPDWAEPDDPFSIGRSDLDPFSPGGGGMVFDPMRSGSLPGVHPNPSAGLPGRLPRGAVPPGARFDPFGPDVDGSGRHPPRGGHRAGPDPDHLPPPGYNDMFM